MKWGILVVFLYVLVLVVLSLPLCAVLFFSSDWDGTRMWSDIAQIIMSAEWWICLAVAITAQAALLTVPVEAQAGRPVTKRSIIPLVVAASFAVSLLIGGVVLSLGEVFKLYIDLQKLLSLGVFLLVWLFWAVFFFRLTRKTPVRGLVDRVCRGLYKGSILELLVAVPAHIYVRQRNECCAGMSTGLGIAFGIAVMLFSFGPGVYFLFVNRCRRRKNNGRVLDQPLS